MEEKFYVDVNVIVYWLGGHPKYGKSAYKWIKRVEGARKDVFLTSSLTIYETLIILAGLLGISLNERDFVEKVLTSFKALKGLKIIPLTFEDELSAEKAMENYGLDYEDAIHYAVAERFDATKIISNDDDFDRTPLKRIF